MKKKIKIAYSLAIASILSFTVGSQLHQFGTKAEFTSDTQSASISIKLSVPPKEVETEEKEATIKKELPTVQPKKEKPAAESSIEKTEKASSPIPTPVPEPKKEIEEAEPAPAEKEEKDEPIAESPETDDPKTDLSELEEDNPNENEVISKDE